MKPCCDLLEKSYLCGINNNREVSQIHTDYRCDLLEKSYLCGINNNPSASNSAVGTVVICLKSLTFVVSITTNLIADLPSLSCDLLEKSYLCGINNN